VEEAEEEEEEDEGAANILVIVNSPPRRELLVEGGFGNVFFGGDGKGGRDGDEITSDNVVIRSERFSWPSSRVFFRANCSMIPFGSILFRVSGGCLAVSISALFRLIFDGE
jgi:hypothetical protein